MLMMLELHNVNITLNLKHVYRDRDVITPQRSFGWRSS